MMRTLLFVAAAVALTLIAAELFPMGEALANVCQRNPALCG
jgi:hypothetical protein